MQETRCASMEEAQTLPALFATRVYTSPQDVAYRFPVGRGWKDVTWSGLWERVDELALGLLELGVGFQEIVALVGDTRPEWGISDLGALFCGAVVAGLQHTSTPDQWVEEIQSLGASLIFVDGGERLGGLRLVRDRLPGLRHVVVWDAPGRLETEKGEISLFELMRLGRKATHRRAELQERLRRLSPDSHAMVLYSNGSQGAPKPSVLRHRNVINALRAQRRLGLWQEKDLALSFLPMCHSSEKITGWYGRIFSNVTAAFPRGRGTSEVLQDLQEIKPTVFRAFPWTFEAIYHRAWRLAEMEGKVASKTFVWACEVARKYTRAQREGSAGAVLKARHRLAEKLVYHKIRALFGERARVFLSCGAPLRLELMELFHGAGVPILESYGVTECSALSASNTRTECRPGSVGRAVYGSLVKLAEDGEVLLSGEGLFVGYHGEQGTRNGWFRTGDLGRMDGDGFLYLLDRKENLFPGPDGSWVAPRRTETMVEASRFVRHCVLVGGEGRPHLGALVVLDGNALPRLTEQLGVAFRGIDKLAEDEAVLSYVQEHLDEVNAQLRPERQIRTFQILSRELSAEAGELTPAGTVRRAEVLRNHQAQVRAVFLS